MHPKSIPLPSSIASSMKSFPCHSFTVPFSASPLNPWTNLKHLCFTWSLERQMNWQTRELNSSIWVRILSNTSMTNDLYKLLQMHIKSGMYSHAQYNAILKVNDRQHIQWWYIIQSRCVVSNTIQVCISTLHSICTIT